VRKVARSRRQVHFGLAAGILIVAAVVLAACNVLLPDAPKNQSPNILDQVQSIDLLPRYPLTGRSDAGNRGGVQRDVVYNGTTDPNSDDNSAAPIQGAAPSASGEGYDLNFENAPVTTVAKVILGDILGAGYIIDPRVRGTVTLSSGRPVAKSDILFVLESALRVDGFALVHDAGGYRIIPGGDAIGTGGVDIAANGQPRAGYGITVVPLRYVSAPTIIKLLEGFATRQGAMRVDAKRNMLIIQGNGPERRSAVDTVMNFDTDWMRGQSVGIFPVHHSTPDPLIAELEKIMDSGEGGLNQNLVKFQAIGRLNAILAATSRPDLLKTAQTWIHRLDNSEIASTGVKVYRVRYGDARHIAQILNQMFGAGGGGAAESATNELAPGGGVTTTSSGPAASSSTTPSAMTPMERLTGGPTSSRQPGTGTENSTSAGTSPALSNPRSGSGGGNGSILPGVRITADVVNNALLIYASAENYRTIERALRQIDRPQPQVAFDATIAEVTLNDSLTYGVQFFLKSENIGAPEDSGSMINTIGSAVLSRVLPGFNILVGSEKTPQVILDALHAVTDVKILSNPSLVVTNNGVATLQVGDQVPIATGSATVLSANNAVVNTINYQNTGIILRVVPRISYNNTVRLDIEQEISNVSDNNATGSLTPTISERKVKSTLTVADGQTVLLAGLISETQNKTRNGIPLLDKLPGYLGDAFSHQNKTKHRTELIIFIRPQIIRDSVDAHLVAEELRAKMKAHIGAVIPKRHSVFGVPVMSR
jgi:general secretion pathway protein D